MRRTLSLRQSGLLRGQAGDAPGTAPWAHWAPWTGGPGPGTPGEAEAEEAAAALEQEAAPPTISTNFLMIAAWGTDGGGDCGPDIDGSGMVDVNALRDVIAAWGSCG